MPDIVVEIPAQLALPHFLSFEDEGTTTESLGSGSLRVTSPTGAFALVEFQLLSFFTAEVIDFQGFLPDGTLIASIGPFEINIFAQLDLTAFADSDIFLHDGDDVLDLFAWTGVTPGEPISGSGITIDFGGGVDRIEFAVASDLVELRPVAEGGFEFTYLGSTGTALNAEQFVFNDLEISVQEDGSLLGGGFGAGLARPEAQAIAYLYETALDRDGDIDLEGLNFWIDVKEQGFTDKEIAAFFLDNPEFNAAFGDVASISIPDLVDLFYQNVLGREGDPDGRAFWIGVFDLDPTYTRECLLVDFATSPENVSGLTFVETLAEVAPGEWEFLV